MTSNLGLGACISMPQACVPSPTLRLKRTQTNLSTLSFAVKPALNHKEAKPDARGP